MTVGPTHLFPVKYVYINATHISKNDNMKVNDIMSTHAHEQKIDPDQKFCQSSAIYRFGPMKKSKDRMTDNTILLFVVFIASYAEVSFGHFSQICIVCVSSFPPLHVER